MKTNFRRLMKMGVKGGVFTIIFLIILPPLIAPHLDAFKAANDQIKKIDGIAKRCGVLSKIDISPWLYSIKSHGESGSAKFRGQVEGENCEQGFSVHLIKKNGLWTVDGVIWR